jgi:hypothetical protein
MMFICTCILLNYTCSDVAHRTRCRPQLHIMHDDYRLFGLESWSWQVMKLSKDVKAEVARFMCTDVHESDRWS